MLGRFRNGRLITGKIPHLFHDLTISKVSLLEDNNNKGSTGKYILATDDGRQLEGWFFPCMIKRWENLGPIFGAVLRALERQYEQISDSEGRILKGHIVNGMLYGAGRIIEADREFIGTFKNGQLKRGIICYSDSIEIVGHEQLPSSSQTISLHLSASSSMDEMPKESHLGKRKRSIEEEKESHKKAYDTSGLKRVYSKQLQEEDQQEKMSSSSSSSSSSTHISQSNIFQLKRLYGDSDTPVHITRETLENGC